jgi:DNA helicase HerA-like ATPase
MNLSAESLRGKQIGVFGMRGTGKTTWTKWLLRKFKKPVVFDPLNEYADFTRYVPETREAGDELKAEFSHFWNTINRKRIGCMAVDEANRIAPNRETPSPALRDIIDLGRHESITYILIARRPTQITTDAVELVDYLVFFRLDGKNDIKYINDIKEGMGDAVAGLSGHKFVFYDRSDGVFRVHEPIKP